jgi:hypothetical protein
MAFADLLANPTKAYVCHLMKRRELSTKVVCNSIAPNSPNITTASPDSNVGKVFASPSALKPNPSAQNAIEMALVPNTTIAYQTLYVSLMMTVDGVANHVIPPRPNAPTITIVLNSQPEPEPVSSSAPIPARSAKLAVLLTPPIPDITTAPLV